MIACGRDMRSEFDRVSTVIPSATRQSTDSHITHAGRLVSAHSRLRRTLRFGAIFSDERIS